MTAAYAIELATDDALTGGRRIMSGCEVMRLQVRVLDSSASSLFGVAYISGKQGRLTTDYRDFKNPRALETGARTGGLI